MRHYSFLLIVFLLVITVQFVSASEIYSLNNTYAYNTGGGICDFDLDSTGGFYADVKPSDAIIRFDANGNILFQYFLAPPKYGSFYNIATGPDHSVFVESAYTISPFHNISHYRVQQIFPNGSSGISFEIEPHTNSMAIDKSNNIYLGNIDVMASNNDKILKYSFSGDLIHEWKLSEVGDGQFKDYHLTDICVDSTGNMYAAGSIGGDVRVLKFSQDGTNVQLSGATGMMYDRGMRIAVDDSHNIYLCGQDEVRKLSPSFSQTALLHLQHDERWSNVVVDKEENIFVGSYESARIYEFSKRSPIDIESITPNAVILETSNIPISVNGRGFPIGTTFKLVNATLGEIVCLPGTITRVNETVLTGDISLKDAKEGLYNVVVTAPDGSTATLEKGFRVLPIPVVIVHGWIGNPSTMRTLTDACQMDNPNVWVFDYRDSARDNPQEIARNEFGPWLASQRDPCDPSRLYTGRVDIVCYSMGALVTRWWMEEVNPQNAGRVRQWIGVAPVNQGAAIADYGEGFLHLAAEIFGRSLGQDGLLHPAEVEMRTNSQTVTTLNNNSRNAETIYRVIVGTNREHITGNGFLHNLGGRTREAIGAGTISQRYQLTPWGDGVVANSQSALPWASTTTDYYEGLCHTALPRSEDVAITIANYLKHPEDTTPDRFAIPNSVDVVPDGLLTWNNMAVRLHFGQSSSGRLTDNRGSVFSIVVSFYLPEGNSNIGRSAATTSSSLPVSLILISPSGRQIGPGATGIGQNEVYSEGQDMVSYDIGNAEQGQWTYSITHAGTVSGDVNVSLSVVSIGNVSVPLTLPGSTTAPMDTNADGKYEDVNGNGRKDFADVVLYFNQMTWIAANEPLAAFDFNGNGRIDFADVVWLFNNL